MRRMIDCTLELARRTDAPRLAAMSRRLVESGLDPSWTAGRVAWHVRHAESCVLTAKVQGGIVGFAIMQYADETAHLNLLAVEPAWRRAGIARRMLAWLEESASVAGTFVVRLEVRASNHTARAFYEALGYREVAVLRGYYQGVENALRLERDLRVERAAPAP